MTEGAAQKFDLQRAREASWNSYDPGALATWLSVACDRIEALEKVLGLASAWLAAHDLYVNTTDRDEYDKLPEKPHTTLQKAREAFRRALEGSPE